MIEQFEEKLNHYDGAEVIERFNIEKQEECSTLDNWVNCSGSLTEVEKSMLLEILSDLKRAGRDWNEEELKMNFVAIIFFIAKLNVTKKIQVFYERKISGEVAGIPISVKVDGMLATPTNANRPKTPYFFLQEAPSRPSLSGKESESKGDDHDPEGQMLAAMILSQNLNNDANPLFGCWLQGKNWNFTTLINNNYCISRQYDASDFEDLQQIVFILRKLKEIVLERIA